MCVNVLYIFHACLLPIPIMIMVVLVGTMSPKKDKITDEENVAAAASFK